MKLSVVIPCLNAAGVIAAQLEALACQQHAPPWELLVADNGSTDGSQRVVEGFADRIAGLRLVDASQRAGQAYARNRGASEARGESLLFCDADDEVAPGFLAAMGRALASAEFVACRMDTERLNPSALVRSRPNPQGQGLCPYDYPPFLPHAAGASLGVRLARHRAIGGFDEAMSPLEDCDYCWRLQLDGTPLVFVPEATVHYRYRDSLSGLFRQARAYGEGNVRLYKKFRSRGMPRLKPYAGVAKWLALALRSPLLLDRERRSEWVWQLGWRVGRLEGSARHRSWAL